MTAAQNKPECGTLRKYGSFDSWEQKKEFPDEVFTLKPAPMDCPEAIHQLMLDYWQKKRAHKPAIVKKRTCR